MSAVFSKIKKAFASDAPRNWGPVAAVSLGFLAYKVPEWLIYGIAPLILPLLPAAENIRAFVLYGIFETCAIGAVFLLLVWYNRTFRDIGLNVFKAAHIISAVLGYFAYIVLTVSGTYIANELFTIPDEQQAVGFVNPNTLELALAFLALVIVVPIAEELLFRGFIFKGVRSSFGFGITALVVSVLFAVAHGQANVGIDVFFLSLVLCYLREKSGSLWPGILLHGLKNAVAFFMIFIYNVG